MTSHKLIIASLFILGAIIFSFGPAGAFTTQWLEDLSDLEAVKGNPFVIAEGRYGDSGGAATFERLLYYTATGPIPPGATGQFSWGNATTYDFSFSYVSSTDIATFTIGGQTLTYKPFNDNPPGNRSYNSIFIRSFAGVQGSTMELTALSLILGSSSPGDLPEVVATASDTDRILWIMGINQDFTVAGTANLSWGPQVPGYSDLAFQIIATEAVPIPGAAWLFASGLIGMAIIRRRAKKEGPWLRR